MPKDLSNIILISDLDGTLLPSNKKVLSKDFASIEHFRALGGTFTIATGRAYASAKPYAECLQVNQPVVLYNGAMVYDYRADKSLWSCMLPKEAREQLKIIMAAYPQIAVEILVEKDTFAVQMNEFGQAHLELERIDHVKCTLDEVPDGWLKVLFAMEQSLIGEFDAFIKSQNFAGASFVDSSENYYEMLPLGINKGVALHELLRIAGHTGKHVVAMGDYNNDIGMLEMADTSIAVGNALDSVKAVANMVVCTCEEGAVSEVIEYLINN